MKTLKELYEIVKAAGGDFPFAVECGEMDWKEFSGDGPYFAFARTPSNKSTAVQDQDSFEILSWGDEISMWQFPADSPYLGDTERAIKNLESAAQLGLIGLTESVMDHEIIEANLQRWQDMGRPWGRLKKHVELINHNGKQANFVDYNPNYGKNGGVVSDQKQCGGLLRVNSRKESCTLTGKTLLNLDDWLLPENVKRVFDYEYPSEPVLTCEELISKLVRLTHSGKFNLADIICKCALNPDKNLTQALTEAVKRILTNKGVQDGTKR